MRLTEKGGAVSGVETESRSEFAGFVGREHPSEEGKRAQAVEGGEKRPRFAALRKRDKKRKKQREDEKREIER